MESLGVLDILSRVVVAGGLAAMPGIVLWTVIFGLMAVIDRLGTRREMPGQARDTALS